jgi:Rrf2 family transcriptional regulator, iron-sulfur cluster assembly transcription factor
MFSRSSEYAIQALTYLAHQPAGKLSGAEEIAAGTRIPLPYLWKLLKILSDEGVVRSFKGVRGRYELARSAKDITIRDVCVAIPKGPYILGCVLNSSECDEDQPCRLHQAWKSFCTQLDNTTLADLVRTPARKIASPTTPER